MCTSPARKLSPSITNLSSPCAIFDTALYDPSSDSIHIMTDSDRQSTLEAQFREFKDSINKTISQRATTSDFERPHSLDIVPSRTDLSQEVHGEAFDEVRPLARASSVSVRQSKGRNFE